MGRRGKQIRDFVRKDGRMAQQKDKWKEGQKERSLTGKKGIFIKQQKGHVLKLSMVSVHQHAGIFLEKGDTW